MKGFFVFLALSAMPVATAGEFDYHLEASRFQGEITDGGLDFDGLELRGGKAFGNWLVFAGYERIDLEPIGIAGLLRFETGSEAIRIGGGYAWPVHDRIDVVSGAGMVKASIHTDVIELSNGIDVSIVPDESDNGYFVVVGLRGRFTERLEGEFRHRFTNVLSDRANDWRVDLRYAFSSKLATVLGYRDFEGDGAVNVALRWYF